MADLRVSVSTIESAHYGDHGERLRRDHEYIPGETIEDLMLRMFPKISGSYQQHDPTDVVELRVVVDRFGVVPDLSPVSSEPPF